MQSPVSRSGGRSDRRSVRPCLTLSMRRAFVPGLLAVMVGFAAPVAAGPDEKIASIGSEVITTGEFATFLQRYLRQKLYHGGSKEQTLRLANEALEAMIDERLLGLAAERRGLRGDPDAVAARIKGFRDQYSESPQWAMIEPRLGEIERDLLLNTKIEELRQVVSEVAAPDEATVRAFYSQNPELFTRPAAYDVDLILIGVPPSALKPEWAAAGEKADGIWRQIGEGADFAALAREHSTEPSSEKGGAVGRIHKGQLPNAAQSVVETMKPGEVSKPIQILEGYVIIRLNERFEAQLQPFETVRERAGGLYLRERSKTQWTEYLAQLRSEADIKTFKVREHVEELLSGN